MAISPIEIKKIKLELSRVTTARLDMEIRIEERLAEIERIKESMAVQESKEAELTAKLEESEKQ
jgi:hypothetical protein